MSRRFVLSFLLLASTIFIYGASDARGCSCGMMATALQEYERADVVVIAKVASVERVEAGEDFRGIRSTVMTVEKVFKGTLKVGEKMTFAQGGGANCIWTFDERNIGTDYLFYLHRIDKTQTVWIAGACGRTEI